MTTSLTIYQIIEMMEARKTLDAARLVLHYAYRIRKADDSGFDDLYTELNRRIPNFLRQDVDQAGFDLPLPPHVNAEHGAALQEAWDTFQDMSESDELLALNQMEYERLYGKTYPLVKLENAITDCYEDADKLYQDYRRASFSEVVIA